jgi:hypothetical protein
MIFKKLRLLSILLLSLISMSVSAQDKIYLMDGSTVQAKIKEVGPRNVVYTRWDNKEGAEYIVARRDVERIVFENGTEESFNRMRGRRPGFDRGNREVRRGDDADEDDDRNRERTRTPIPGYGNNILSIAPLFMTNESAAGVGVSYERMLDKQGIFALYIPVAFSFYDDETQPWVSSQYRKESRVFTYVYPGAKIYPAGSAHRVTYSVGPSLGFGFGSKYKETRRIDPGTGSTIISYNEGSVFKTGFLINNGLNIQPTKKLYIGLELGLGIFYYNNEIENFGAGDEPLVQFNFKMGYRF